MLENSKLRIYLLRGFLLTLVFIGIAQLFVNGILGSIILPLIDDTLKLNGLLSSNDIRNAYILIFQGLIVFLGNRFIPSYVPKDQFYHFFGRDMVETIGTFSKKLTASQTIVYIFASALCLLVVIMIWLLPYIIGGMIFARLVTKKVNELEKARIEKEHELEKEKNLLLSDIAHDIKTPITTVAGFSKALADGEVKEENQKEYLEAVYRKSMQMSDLVSLLFEYVKLDSTGYQLKRKNEDFCEIVRECIVRQYTDFEEKNMELDINIPEESIFLSLDKTQCERAITNILVNTIRHNPEGTPVFIDLEKKGKNVVLRISDKGTFIEKETAKHLFDPFVQSDKSRTSGKGSGLGLSITKKIVEMHGGKIVLIQYLNVEKYGKVKTFEITL